MTNEKHKKSSLPKVPKPAKNLTTRADDNYYIKTQATSLLPKYSGRNKLEVFITEDDKKKLDQLESLFLNGFDLNHIICFAYKCIENHHPKAERFKWDKECMPNYSVRIKPSLETLEAILSYEKEEGKSYLAGLGIYILSNELSLDSMFKADEG